MVEFLDVAYVNNSHVISQVTSLGAADDWSGDG
jgi:hypothetical protein